jgi:uncharacterized membrane protein YhiD involved in acid resistance
VVAAIARQGARRFLDAHGMPEGYFNSFFSSEAGPATRIFYISLLGLTLVYSIISLICPLITPVCDIPLETPPPKALRRLVQGLEGGLEDAPNPSYQPDPCKWMRYPALLGMNKWEADQSRRIVMSILMGSIIGFERRRADRPAGIRTMAMVCLGACVFTLGSMYAFVDGTMGWDASRVSAAIPSGVGFLGAASIWKGTKQSQEGQAVPEVHGLTTATSVWLSAAIGILCGGGLYVPGLFTTCVGVVYLRFAPRLQVNFEEGQEEGDCEGGGESSAHYELRQPLSPQATQGAGAHPPLQRERSKRGSEPKQPSILA